MADKGKRRFSPDYSTPPGATLKESIEALGWDQSELARRAGISRKTVNGIIHGRETLSPETAVKLERTIGVPASFWLSLEADHREAVARKAERERLAKSAGWLNEVPLGEMVRRNWVERHSDKVDQLRAVLSFFGVASPGEWLGHWRQVCPQFRASRSTGSRDGAVAAWLRAGELKAADMGIGAPFSRRRFRAALKEARALTVLPPVEFLPRLARLCHSAGVALVYTPTLPGAPVYGAAWWTPAGLPVLQLSMRGKEDGQFWFSFFHEAAHLLLHGKKEVFVDIEVGKGGAASSWPSCNRGATWSLDEEADAWARNFLIPEAAFRAWLKKAGPKIHTTSAIREFAGRIGISPGVVLGRLQHDARVPFASALNSHLKQRVTPEMMAA